MTYRRFSLWVELSILVTLGLAVTQILSNTDQSISPWRSIAAVTCLVVMRIVAGLSQRVRPLAEMSSGQRKLFVHSLLGGAFIVVAAMAFKTVESFSLISGNVTDRTVTGISGVFLIAMGNFVPKVHGQPSKGACAGPSSPRLHRWIGTVFFLVGVGVLLTAFVVAPGRASDVTMALVMTALALAIVPMAWVTLRGNRSRSHAEE